jgi:acetylornithine deacetylase/succinyl-diaminopimelate desuccinylase family protein
MQPVVELLAELVRIPSMNPMGRARTGQEYSEGPLASYVAEYLRKHHVDVELHEFASHRPNVIAHIDAGARRTILLEAHLDTVHADGMSVPAFEGRVVDGRLQGRGACDTKGSLAAFLDAVTSLLSEGTKFNSNVVFAAVADEEYQFSGAKLAGSRGLRADFGICGEPTRLHIIRAHKGVLRWRLRTHGRAAHSAYPERGDNAIYAMGRVLNVLERHAQTLGSHTPHPSLGFPTMSVGVIEGGQAVNIVPEQCWIEVDRRTLPGESQTEILEEVKRALSGLSQWSMDMPHLDAPGMDIPEQNDDLQRLCAAIGKAGVTPIVETANYATDAGIYSALGMPCVVFGPGDIADAHTAGESIDLSELVSAREIIRRFLQ